MKQIFLLPILILSIHFVDAQERYVSQIITGNIYYPKESTDVEGSPFASEQWMHGTAVDKQNYFYKNLQLKFDASGRNIIYTDKNVLYAMTGDITTVMMYPNYPDTNNVIIYKRGMLPTPNEFVQVLTEGKISLIKQLKKNISEYYEYNSAVKKWKYDDIIKYGIIKDGKFTAVTLNKKDLIAMFEPNMQSKAEEFIKSNNINVKTEAGWIAVIHFL
jgi:hypothetical protein